MHKYVFILGRKWELSANELISVFGEPDIVNKEVFIKDFNEPIESPVKTLDRLGGTIKIGEIFDEVDSIGEVDKKLIEHLKEVSDKKVIFSLNLYNFAQYFKNDLKNLLKKIKDGLRGRGGKVRFLNKPGENIKSVVVLEEKLFEKGTDLIVVRNKGKFLLGKTVAVQNFKKYSKRDYDRPARNAKSGMLPPKLAQIMINLACGDEDESLIYDPFCGSGTVLMEGLLMGHKVIGSDISEKAILDSQKNLDWVVGEFEMDKSKIIDVFVKDATELTDGDMKIQPDYIVGETYLGPPQVKSPSEEEMSKNFGEIEEIVLKSLEKFKEIVKSGSKIVIAIPFYRKNNKKYYLQNLVEKVKELGYDVSDLFQANERGSLLYDRKDQIVGREIFKMTIPG